MSKEKLPFFVYGTLLPGQPNARLWGKQIVKIASAVLPDSSLYDLGPYPVMMIDEGTGVQGAVIWVEATGYNPLLQRLDQLEGINTSQPNAGLYQRLICEPLLESGEAVAAWVYAGNDNRLRQLPQIPHGDWLAYALNKRGPLGDVFLDLNLDF